MSADVVTTTITEGVGRMRIDRPENMNAFTPRVLEGLHDAIRTFEADDDVRSIMFTAAGDRAFCAGVDLGEEGGLSRSTPEALDTVHRAQRVLKALRRSPLPVVGAINGYAMGAGMDLALGCDIKVVKADATLSQSYVNVGLSPGDGGAYMLPRLVGEEVAKDLIFSGRQISGTEAGELGIASTVVDGGADRTREVAFDRARELANGPSVALGNAKQLINEAHDVNLETGLEHAIEAIGECRETDDHAEAVAAFEEDRDPEFTGE
ncbi:enoyl-CoA hydratase/isomerase family protein [Natrinema halophilum]|uniref:enoyl-CoA hydratase/isomerase family protein n=1 Tax=Natrinema halophilum TaxID=1699371 RepID=UPI001F3EDB39|nr:enoyl-CoA hydratase/isomerase family protein [Natrinema halophilum]UHQ96108.1 enoyl-CoA hydratase/isomerase family protein [Natrinema halophilum]